MCERKVKIIIKKDWGSIRTEEKYFSGGGFTSVNFTGMKSNHSFSNGSTDSALAEAKGFKEVWRCYQWVGQQPKNQILSLNLPDRQQRAESGKRSINFPLQSFFLLSPQPESADLGLGMKKWVKMHRAIITLSLALWYSSWTSIGLFILMSPALSEPFGSLKSRGLQESFKTLPRSSEMDKSNSRVCSPVTQVGMNLPNRDTPTNLEQGITPSLFPPGNGNSQAQNVAVLAQGPCRRHSCPSVSIFLGIVQVVGIGVWVWVCGGAHLSFRGSNLSSMLRF